MFEQIHWLDHSVNIIIDLFVEHLQTLFYFDNILMLLTYFYFNFDVFRHLWLMHCINLSKEFLALRGN